MVEDHPGLREQLTETLTDAGFVVAAAADARAGRKLMDEGPPPALVCVDLVLPEGSGYDLCEHVKSTPSFANTRVLVISGRALPTDRAFAEEAGADAFLAKPFSPEALLAAVRTQLSAPARLTLRRSETEAA